MNIIYKTPEAQARHVEYEVDGNYLTVESITLRLDKYEKDYDVHMDICRDKFGNLTTGVIPGWSERYVAQIDIPGRTYHDADSGETNEDGEAILVPEPDPFDMDKATLTLWETEE